MRLDRLTVALRPRSGWQAIDLGLRMVQHWWRAVWPPWLLLAGAVLAVLALALGDRPGWLLLAFWWLKPVYDRLLLSVFAQALFDSPPTTRHTLRRLPAVLRRSGLLHALTLGRFQLAASTVLPVAQLEGLRGPARRRRQRLLRAGDDHSFWLLLACGGMELALTGGLLLLGWLLIPQPLLPDALELLSAELTAPDSLLWLALAAYLPAVLVIEPIYVAGGFALYLNRRTDLEGWDIELAFRRMARRLGEVVAGVLLVVGIGLSMGIGQMAGATEVAVGTPSPQPSPPQGRGSNESPAAAQRRPTYSHPRRTPRASQGPVGNSPQGRARDGARRPREGTRRPTPAGPRSAGNRRTLGRPFFGSLFWASKKGNSRPGTQAIRSRDMTGRETGPLDLPQPVPGLAMLGAAEGDLNKWPGAARQATFKNPLSPLGERDGVRGYIPSGERAGVRGRAPTGRTLSIIEPPADLHETVRQVAARHAHAPRTRHVWVPRDTGPGGSQWSPGAAHWLAGLANGLARLVKGVLAAGALVLLWLAVRHWRAWLPERVARRSVPPPVAPTEAAGADLPADIPAAARAALARGERRAALSLLYRGALARLGLPAGATEAEVLAQAARELPPPQRDYLQRLGRAWLATAWAHRAPPAEAVAALCRDWAAAFGAEGRR